MRHALTERFLDEGGALHTHPLSGSSTRARRSPRTTSSYRPSVPSLRLAQHLCIHAMHMPYT